MANETIPDLTAGTPPYAAGTLVELAVPDGLGGFVSRKGLLPDLTGAIPLRQRTITEPVAYLDLELPAGYSKFELSLTKIVPTNVGQSGLAMAVSTDGGVTFINDTINSDSYVTVSDVVLGALNGTPASASGILSDALMDTGDAGTSGMLGGGVFSADIFPGDAATLANVASYTASYESTAIYSYLQALCWSGLNPAATVPPVPARINAVRILPYGTGHANPPNSGDTFTCEYFLSGVPTP